MERWDVDDGYFLRHPQKASVADPHRFHIWAVGLGKNRGGKPEEEMTSAVKRFSDMTRFHNWDFMNGYGKRSCAANYVKDRLVPWGELQRARFHQTDVISGLRLGKIHRTREMEEVQVPTHWDTHPHNPLGQGFGGPLGHNGPATTEAQDAWNGQIWVPGIGPEAPEVPAGQRPVQTRGIEAAGLEATRHNLHKIPAPFRRRADSLVNWHRKAALARSSSAHGLRIFGDTQCMPPCDSEAAGRPTQEINGSFGSGYMTGWERINVHDVLPERGHMGVPGLEGYGSGAMPSIRSQLRDQKASSPTTSKVCGIDMPRVPIPSGGMRLEPQQSSRSMPPTSGKRSARTPSTASYSGRDRGGISGPSSLAFGATPRSVGFGVTPRSVGVGATPRSVGVGATPRSVGFRESAFRGPFAGPRGSALQNAATGGAAGGGATSGGGGDASGAKEAVS